MNYIVIENSSRDKDRPNYSVLGRFKTLRNAEKAIKDDALGSVDGSGALPFDPDPEWGNDCIIAKIEKIVRPAPYSSRVSVRLIDQR
jgi:hypothetical protein